MSRKEGIGKDDDHWKKEIERLTTKIGKAWMKKPNDYVGRGDAHACLQSFEEALKDYEIAIETNRYYGKKKSSLPVYQKCAEICFKLGDFKRANAFCEDIGKYEPKDVGAIFIKSLCFVHENKFHETPFFNMSDPVDKKKESPQYIGTFRKIIKDFNFCVVSKHRIQESYFAIGVCELNGFPNRNFEKAAVAFNKAIGYNAKDLESRLNHSLTLYHLKKYGPSQKGFEKCLEMMAKDSEKKGKYEHVTLYFLGMIFDEWYGNIEKSIEYLNRAIECCQNPDSKEKILTLLKEKIEPKLSLSNLLRKGVQSYEQKKYRKAHKYFKKLEDGMKNVDLVIPPLEREKMVLCKLKMADLLDDQQQQKDECLEDLKKLKKELVGRSKELSGEEKKLLVRVLYELGKLSFESTKKADQSYSNFNLALKTLPNYMEEEILSLKTVCLYYTSGLEFPYLRDILSSSIRHYGVFEEFGNAEFKSKYEHDDLKVASASERCYIFLKPTVLSAPVSYYWEYELTEADSTSEDGSYRYSYAKVGIRPPYHKTHEIGIRNDWFLAVSDTRLKYEYDKNSKVVANEENPGFKGASAFDDKERKEKGIIKGYTVGLLLNLEGNGSLSFYKNKKFIGVGYENLKSPFGGSKEFTPTILSSSRYDTWTLKRHFIQTKVHPTKELGRVLEKLNPKNLDCLYCLASYHLVCKKDCEKALELYQKILEKVDGSHFESIRNLAFCYHKLKMEDKFHAILHKCLEVFDICTSSENPEEEEEEGEGEDEEEEEGEQEEKKMKLILKKKKQLFEIYLWRALFVHYKKSKFEKCIDDVSKAIELLSTSKEDDDDYVMFFMRFFRGYNYFRLQEFQKAIDDFSFVIEGYRFHNLEETKVYYHFDYFTYSCLECRAICYAGLKKMNEALLDFNELDKIFGIQEEEGWRGYGYDVERGYLVFLQHFSTKDEDLEYLYENFYMKKDENPYMSHRGRSNYRRDGKEITAENPDFYDQKRAFYLVNRGNLYFEIKELDKSLQDFSSCVQLYSDPYLGDEKKRKEDEESRRQRDLKHPRFIPNELLEQVYLGRARVMTKKEEFLKSSEDCKKVLNDVNKNSALAHVRLGDNEKKMGKLKNSFESLTKAIEINPELSEAYFRRAQVYQMLKKYDEAISDMNLAIQYYEKNVDILKCDFSREPVSVYFYERGKVYVVKKEFERAFLDFSEAVRLDSFFTDAIDQKEEVVKELGEDVSEEEIMKKFPDRVISSCEKKEEEEEKEEAVAIVELFKFCDKKKKMEEEEEEEESSSSEEEIIQTKKKEEEEEEEEEEEKSEVEKLNLLVDELRKEIVELKKENTELKKEIESLK